MAPMLLARIGKPKALLAALAVLLVASVAIGCGGDASLPTGDESVTLDPADFTTEITNPYWPMAPGDHWVYRERDGSGGTQKVKVTVTDRAKTIAGIEARVVHDVVCRGWSARREHRRLVRTGRGRQRLVPGREHDGVRERQGRLQAGSWEARCGRRAAGHRDARRSATRMANRQEYYAGEAEDRAEVLSVARSRWKCRRPSYRDVVMTKD